MESQLDAYRKLFLSRARQGAWLRGLVWGGIKVVLEGVAFFIHATNIWMRASIGLIWVGIAMAGVSLFYVTIRINKMLPSPSGLRVFIILEIIALAFLAAQVPFLALGLFFPDGIVTIISTTLFIFAGLGVNQVLRRTEASDEDLFS